jgi:hypothetical protein
VPKIRQDSLTALAAAADVTTVRLMLRHPASFVLVLSACATIAAVFIFVGPAYHPKYESKMIDFSTVRYYSPDVVRNAFAEQGIELRVSSRFYGITTLSRVAVPDADALQVMVAPRTGRASWGPKLEPYDERFGNVAVMYGHDDAELLTNIKSAVSSLSNA